MAEEPLPTDAIVKKRVTKTYWLCPDGHWHEQRLTAEACLAGRPKRLKRERERLVRERDNRIRQEVEARERARQAAESLALKAKWQASEIYKSELDPMVSLALVGAGVVDRQTFREIFVTADKTFDLPKLQETVALHVDDYPAVLAWLNKGD